MPDSSNAAALVDDVLASQPPAPEVDEASRPDLHLPDRFTLDEHGLRFWPPPKKEGDKPPTPIKVAGVFEIVAETCDETSSNWGLLLRWHDRAGQLHQWAMPRRLIHGDGNAIAAELEHAGLTCGTGKLVHEQLKEFFGEVTTSKRTRCVTRAGWHRLEGQLVFLLPDGVCFAPDRDGAGIPPVMQTESAIPASAFSESGKLDDWQRAIAGYAIGNDRLALFLAAAFAGPLLDIVSAQSGGIHLFGRSQTGKTTALRVAGSVWGRGDETGQIRTWRATANGLEGTAAESTDSVLALDELSQADAREVSETVYMIANQAGKARADRSGAARRRQTWRVLLLSTGEVTLAAKLAEIGKRPLAGQQVRLIDLPADAGVGLGVFQNLHGLPTAAALASHLCDAARCVYGTAGRAFLTELVPDYANDPANFRERAGTEQDEFLTAHLPHEADGQVQSVARRFALIATAGALATNYGVLPWPEGEAARAAASCFAAWLAARGGVQPAEDIQAVEAVRGFIALHGSSRFENVRAEGTELAEERVVNRAGFKRRDGETREFLIHPDIWTAEVCKGLDARRVADTLRKAELLLGGDARHRADSIKLPGYSRMRLYRVSGAILGADAAGACDAAAASEVPGVPEVSSR